MYFSGQEVPRFSQAPRGFTISKFLRANTFGSESSLYNGLQWFFICSNNDIDSSFTHSYVCVQLSDECKPIA
jgi:hypothetical protein